MEECVFYSKVGTCRHGEKCSKVHYKPKYSQILKISNMYTGEDLEGFVVDLFTEASKFATVEEFLIAGNNSEHLKGTVYLSLNSAKAAEAVFENFEGRWYNEMPLYCSLCPIKDLWGACCREPDACTRGGDCNYLHPIAIPRDILEPLFSSQPRRERGGPRSEYRGGARDSRRPYDRPNERDRGGRQDRGGRDERPREYSRQDARAPFPDSGRPRPRGYNQSLAADRY